MTLSEWRKQKIPYLREMTFEPPTRQDVTVVIYHFWEASESSRRFEETEFSILQTWQWCGKLPVKIITNEVCPAMSVFANQWGGVTPIVSPRLRPGMIMTMSLDLVGHLSEYFDTDFVLIVQNDGFPLRSGFDEFVGPYTYCGPLFVRPHKIVPWIEKIFQYANGNGGFCLRRRDICVEANRLWEKWRWLINGTNWMIDDGCYCYTFRLLSRKYRKMMRFPSREKARLFGYDQMIGVPVPQALPFGFHGANSFESLMEKFGAEIH